jgi:hypothetical protein
MSAAEMRPWTRRMLLMGFLALLAMFLLSIWSFLLRPGYSSKPGRSSKGEGVHSSRTAIGHPVFGILTKFSVSPAEIALSDRVHIHLHLTNVTADPVEFRYIACIEDHIELLDTNDRVVWQREGAPIHSCPYEEVRIAAGETVEREEGFQFDDYYSVPAGEYQLRFKYDARLMQGAPVRDPWIPWSKKSLPLVVRD